MQRWEQARRVIETIDTEIILDYKPDALKELAIGLARAGKWQEGFEIASRVEVTSGYHFVETYQGLFEALVDRGELTQAEILWMEVYEALLKQVASH